MRPTLSRLFHAAALAAAIGVVSPAAIAQKAAPAPRGSPVTEGEAVTLPGAPVGPDGKPIIMDSGRVMTGRTRFVFTIDMRWLGASAYKVEHDVTVPVQRAIQGLPGLVEVKSTATGGHVQTRATFDSSIDPTTTAMAIRTRLDQNKYRLPRDASAPQVAWHREMTGHL